MKMRRSNGVAARLKRFLAEKGAATSIEYALLASIAVAVIAAVSLVGGGVVGLFETVSQAVASVVGSS